MAARCRRAEQRAQPLRAERRVRGHRSLTSRAVNVDGDQNGHPGSVSSNSVACALLAAKRQCPKLRCRCPSRSRSHARARNRI
eukprot:3164009-Pyramimonas_sp.AAC.1